MSISTKYGHVITNYDMNMAMNMVILLESLEWSYLIVRLFKFFLKYVKTHVYYFSSNITHKRTSAQVLNLFLQFQNMVKINGMTIRSKGLNLPKLLVDLPCN
jgi:hypothetical protein